MLINAVAEFIALTNFDYLFAQSSSVYHIGTAVISMWLMYNVPSMNTMPMWIWTALHISFSMFMFNTASLFATADIAEKIKYGAVQREQMIEKPIEKQFDIISSEA
jgi:hypothetical protein